MQFDPLAAPLGADIHGLTVGGRHSAEAASLLRSALAEHGVLIVRAFAEPDDAAALVRLAESFGEPLVSGESVIVETTNLGPDDSLALPAPAGHGATAWTAEGSFLADPPVAVLTFAVEVPTRGGQTQFADMRKALRLLPAEDRAEISGLSLVHLDPTEPTSWVEHPWIRAGNDGTESLYMGAHAAQIAGREVGESMRWFEEVEAQLPVHDVFLEHRWLPGDLVIHDPRIVMQRTLGYDIGNERRRLLGVMVGPPTA